MSRPRKVVLLFGTMLLSLLIVGFGAYGWVTTGSSGLYVIRSTPADPDAFAMCSYVGNTTGNIKKWGSGFIAMVGACVFWATGSGLTGMRKRW